jgi:cysteine-rich repeat protein
MQLHARTVALGVLFASPALAAPTFTGDVLADFTEAAVVNVPDPDAIDVGIPLGFPAGTISGNDMRGVRFLLDSATDTLYIGMDTYGIAGDVDGDGDPNATGPELGGSGGVDTPNWSGTESFLIVIDKDQDGTPDIITGVNSANDVGAFGTFAFSNAPFALIQPSVIGFGAPLPGNSGMLFATPSAGQPDLEFTIENWSTVPLSSGSNPVSDIDFMAFIGSLSDAGIGEDFIPGIELGTVPFCGNGTVEFPEVCDDGNTVDGDLCDSTCQIEPICGDGMVNQPGEQCDDGNDVDTDGCRNSCELPFCGDGVESDGEECDDGDTDNTNGCTNACTVPFCGDGIESVGEQCDDGNMMDGDGCESDCTITNVCGDGLLGAGEECDDGNTDNGDGCDATCLIERCPPTSFVGAYHTGGNLTRIDQLFGTSGPIDVGGVLASYGFDGVTALAYDTANDVAYAATGDADDALWSVDLTDGTLSLVGPFGNGATNIQAMDLANEASSIYGFDPGYLYGVSIDGVGFCNPNCFFRIDPATGEAMMIGPVAAQQIRGLSFSPVTGELWAYDPGPKELYTVDPTGGLTLEAEVDDSVQFDRTGIDTAFSLAHDCLGNLYTVDVAYGTLVWIDPASGFAQWVGDFGSVTDPDGGFDLASLDKGISCDCPVILDAGLAACEVTLRPAQVQAFGRGTRIRTWVDVTNLRDPIFGWDLTWQFQDNAQVTNTMGATVTQNGPDVTFVDDGPGILGPGATTSFGIEVLSLSGQPPVDFRLNGELCTVRVDN